MQTSTLNAAETITTTIPDTNTDTGFPDVPEDNRHDRHSCCWDESICDNAATHFIIEFCQDPDCTASHQSYYCAQHYAIMLSRIIAHLKECPGYKHPEPCDENRNVTLAHIAAFGKIEDDDIDVRNPRDDSASADTTADDEPLWATDDTVTITPDMSLADIRAAIEKATEVDYFHTPLHVVRFKPLPADLPQKERSTEVLQFDDLHLAPVTHWSLDVARDFERGANTSMSSSLHMVYESVSDASANAPINASATYGRFVMHAQIPPTPQMIAEDDDPDVIPGIYGIVTDRVNLVFPFTDDAVLSSNTFSNYGENVIEVRSGVRMRGDRTADGALYDATEPNSAEILKSIDDSSRWLHQLIDTGANPQMTD